MGAFPNAHPDLRLILLSFGFQSETPLGLMQATCFMAANDTMAFKLNTDSIANSILVGTHGDFGPSRSFSRNE